MPPKANEAIDSLIEEEGDYGFWDLYSNWRKLVNAESPETELEALLEFYKNAEAGPYAKTYVPGEHELLARMLGIEDHVNQYMYANTLSIPETDWEGKEVDSFETLIEGWQQGKGTELEDVMLYQTYEEEPWSEVIMGNFDGEKMHRYPGVGKSYTKEESPLTDYGDYFGVNPQTKFGKNLQDRLDYYFTQAKLYKDYRENPDTGKLMLAGDDPLLGSVYFDEDGNFVDVWDISEGEHESPIPPLDFIFNPRKSFLSSLGYNIGRRIAGEDYEKNVPIVKGRAHLLGDLSPYMGREGF